MAPARLERLKREVITDVDRMSGFTQRMVDQVFSFGELGFQEVETSRYLTGILADSGFRVERGVAGIPTAWVATWGSGRPVISLGSDIDGVPDASQVPGLVCREPLVVGAPGHGEGHNSGQAVNLTAALAVRRILQREGLSGTIVLWPGVAEELLGTKAYLVRAGIFREADAVLYTHVGYNLQTFWGMDPSSGLVSVQYEFEGKAAHAGAAPWRGRSALDAVQLMEVGWNFRREHLRLPQRSHSVIVRGGEQPNVVPARASIWYYLREGDYSHIMEMWAIADSIAQGAALMTGTRLSGERVVGSAWPGHFNKPLAEMLTENARRVGLPRWSEDDQTLARAVQREVGAEIKGLDTALAPLEGPVPEEQRMGGGSDDIGDISWNVPTVVLTFPSNIAGTPGHSWADAIAMATPIAHKGATAGAKVQAATMLDLVARPALVDSAWSYFRSVQTKTVSYRPIIRPTDQPAIEMNAKVLDQFRPAMRPYYYDAAKFPSYLAQLGVKYPAVRQPDGSCPARAGQ